MEIYCESCKPIVLEEKIKNRDTELQRVYDMMCDKEKELETTIGSLNSQLELATKDLRGVRDMIDKCILREQELGRNVL